MTTTSLLKMDSNSSYQLFLFQMLCKLSRLLKYLNKFSPPRWCTQGK